MTGTTRPKQGKANASHAVKPPRPVVGEPFKEDDLQLPIESGRVERHTKARTTTILVVAMVAFYGIYLAHEWWVGNSFEKVGRFIENALVMFLGWCIGKGTYNSRDGP